MILLFAGCSKKESIDIKLNGNGYSLYQYFDKDCETVLQSVNDEIGETELIEQMENKGCLLKSYGKLTEVKYGLSYQLGLVMAKEVGSEKTYFVGYGNRIGFDHWPNEAERGSIQKAFDELIELYGEPEIAERIPDYKDIFSDSWKFRKGATWTKAHVTFAFEYEQPTDTAWLCITNENSKFVTEHKEAFRVF